MAAPFGDLRDRDPQHASCKAGTRVRSVARSSETHGTREPAEVALDQMKARLALSAARRFFARNEQRIGLHQQAHPRRCDAGKIDGCSEFGVYWRIVLPLVKPGLAVLAIFTFVASWNDFFWPLIVTTDTSMFVANLGIASLVGPYDYQYGILLSGALLASVPIVIIFLFFQRQFLEGLTQGAVK